MALSSPSAAAPGDASAQADEYARSQNQTDRNLYRNQYQQQIDQLDREIAEIDATIRQNEEFRDRPGASAADIDAANEEIQNNLRDREILVNDRTLVEEQLELMDINPANEEEYNKQLGRIDAADNAANPDHGDVFLCAGCPVVESFLIGGLTLAESLAAKIGGSLQRLIAIVLALWLLYRAATLLLPFGPMDGKANKGWQDIGARTGLALAVVVALSPPAMGVYQNYIIYPLIHATVDASDVMLKAGKNIADADNASAFDCGLPEGGDTKKQLATAVSCQTDFVSRIIWRGLEIGLRSVGMGLVPYRNQDGQPDPNQEKGWLERLAGTIMGTVKIVGQGPEYVARAFMRIIQVMVVIGTYAYAWAFYPLYMMNVVMKWAILSVLWPLFAAAFIFPATRSATIAGIKGLLHSSLTMVFLATTAGVMLAILEPMFMELDPDNLLAIGDQANEVTSIDAMDGKYWVIVLSGFILIHMMKKASALAGVFTGSKMDTDIADGLWKMLTKVAWITADLFTWGNASKAQKFVPKKIK